MTLARYRARYLPPRSAVLGISFSGKTGRPVEALVQAERFGHLTIGLTNDPNSALGRAAQPCASYRGSDPGVLTWHEHLPRDARDADGSSPALGYDSGAR